MVGELAPWSEDRPEPMGAGAAPGVRIGAAGNPERAKWRALLRALLRPLIRISQGTVSEALTSA